MSDIVYSHAGVTIAVSTTAQNDDLDETGFASLAYTPISNVGMIGEYGVATNLIVYDLMDSLVASKSKGMTDAGNPELELARTDSDPGQVALAAIGGPNYFDHHAYRVTKQDSSIDYLRGLAVGPIIPGGRNEDFDLHKYVLGLVQVPVHAVAIIGDWLFATGFLSATGIITPGGVIPE